MSPIEVTTKYATSVDTLAEAWRFVMTYVDQVGPKPHIRITPLSIYSMADIGNDDAEPECCFEVLVSGMVEEDS